MFDQISKSAQHSMPSLVLHARDYIQLERAAQAVRVLEREQGGGHKRATYNKMILRIKGGGYGLAFASDLTLTEAEDTLLRLDARTYLFCDVPYSTIRSAVMMPRTSYMAAVVGLLSSETGLLCQSCGGDFHASGSPLYDGQTLCCVKCATADFHPCFAYGAVPTDIAKNESRVRREQLELKKFVSNN